MRSHSSRVEPVPEYLAGSGPNAVQISKILDIGPKSAGRERARTQQAFDYVDRFEVISDRTSRGQFGGMSL
jgi:hypothetical protein